MANDLFSAGAYRLHQQAADLLRRLFLQERGEPGPEHLLLAMLSANHELLRAITSSLGLSRYVLERSVFDHTLKCDADRLRASRDRFYQAAQKSVAARQRSFIDEWDLVQGVFRADSPAIRAALSDVDASAPRILALLDTAEMQAFALRYQQAGSPPPAPGPRQLRRGKRRAQLAVLEQFGRNLNVPAEQNQLAPVRFRDREIQVTLETLCRQGRRNPILVGEPGVGKSAVVVGLTQWLVAHQNQEHRLGGHIIYQINLGTLTAAAGNRREMVERVESLIAACRGQPVVLAIEDFARAVPARRGEELEPTMAVLRRALLRGDIQCIGECTPAVWRHQVEPDSELLEVCCPVTVPELSREETCELLAELTPGTAAFHQVQIGSEAVTTTVELGEHYLPEQRFPGKAIGLLDAAAARVSLQSEGPRTVGAAEVADIVARQTGLDARHLLSFRVEDLRAIETFLKERLLGQDPAIRQVLDTIQLARSGLSLRPQRPDGVFLLVGPTGVGKTELARSLSEALQGSPHKLIRFDMSEFLERHTVAKLIGAPPGYIGHDEEAQLIKRVRANPRGVVLFDEVEKAHPDVLNLFLQIFDDGRLTDSHGLTADFSQTIVLMTSNLGTRDLDGEGIAAMATEQRDRYLTQVCTTAVKKFFPPEFLNRLDAVICMSFLTAQTVTRIAEKQLSRLLNDLARRGKTVEITNAAFDLVVREGYSAQFGARHLQRTVERRLLNPLALFLVDHPEARRLQLHARENQMVVQAL